MVISVRRHTDFEFMESLAVYLFFFSILRYISESKDLSLQSVLPKVCCQRCVAKGVPLTKMFGSTQSWLGGGVNMTFIWKLMESWKVVHALEKRSIIVCISSSICIVVSKTRVRKVFDFCISVWDQRHYLWYWIECIQPCHILWKRTRELQQNTRKKTR